MKSSINFIIIILFLSLVQSLLAQDSLRARYGVFAGRTENIHTVDFRALPGVPNCCPLFENGTGGGAFVGAQYEFPIAAQLLLSLSASYADHSALLSTREAVAIVVADKLRNGAFEHTVNAAIKSVGVEPVLRLRLGSGLFAGAGLRVAMMLSPTYAQQEEIVAPLGVGTFLDSLGRDSGARTRNRNSGALPDARPILLQGIIGLSYELPMNAEKTLTLVPGVSYALGLLDVVRGTTWKPNGIRVALGVNYSLPTIKEIVRDTIVLRDTGVAYVAHDAVPRLKMESRTESDVRSESDMVAERTIVREHWVRETPRPHEFYCTLAATGVDGGTETPTAALHVEEFLRTTTHPLLGFIFFDNGSSRVPERYEQITPADADAFRAESLYDRDALGITHAMLDIIGYNLRAQPGAHLTVTGCNADVGEEKGNRTLARERAETVKNYLVDVWRIAAERINVIARDLPSMPSNPRTPEGMEENRRVEISSDMPNVVDVFVAHDTLRAASPAALRLKPILRSMAGIGLWQLRVMQHGAVLKEFSGHGTPPAVVEWNFAADEHLLPRTSEPLVCELRAANTAGDECVSQVTMSTSVVTLREKGLEHAEDYRIDRYNLVLFGFGTSTITAAQHRITELIRARLTPNSSVTVDGYTDRTGDPQGNRRLAAARAQATAGALGRVNAGVHGIGADRLLYSNDTPEGRFYCRTVQVTVKTKER